jgi:broad specificity phosphatase PhoE
MPPADGPPANHARTLLLARHGETEWNLAGRWQGHTDIALSATGRGQAAALAERLGNLGVPVARIRSSDLARARETAEIVARRLGVGDLVIDARLRERAFGVFEGLTRRECEDRYPDVWASYERDRKLIPPGGEPHADVVARLRAAVADALEPAPGDGHAVLLVGHGGSLRLFLADRYGRPFPPIGNAALLRITAAGEHPGEIEDLG